MGCVSSRDINDTHPNIFQVMNIDDDGNPLKPGQLEVTDTHLILYQKKKAPLKWPYKHLRRYGFDQDVFSFESGRRCPVGTGIYAFRCARARQLFMLLQVSVAPNTTEDGLPRDNSAIAQGPPVPPRSSVDSNYLEPSVRPVQRGNIPANIRLTSDSGRGMSVRINRNSIGSGSTSNGPLSPQEVISPSPSIPYVLPLTPLTTVPSITLEENDSSVHYVNEEILGSPVKVNDTIPELKTSTGTVSDDASGPVISSPSSLTPPVTVFSSTSECNGESNSPSYVNVEINPDSSVPRSPTSLNTSGELSPGCLSVIDSQHLYMNIMPFATAAADKKNVPSNGSTTHFKISFSSSAPATVTEIPEEPEDFKHCYVNLTDSEVKTFQKPLRLPSHPSSSTIHFHQAPLTPPIREVSYAVLDLNTSKDETGLNKPSEDIKSTSSTSSSEPFKKNSNGYAKIDFDRTVALSHSKSHRQDEEGDVPRKSRHGSTFFERLTRHSRHNSSD